MRHVRIGSRFGRVLFSSSVCLSSVTSSGDVGVSSTMCNAIRMTSSSSSNVTQHAGGSHRSIKEYGFEHCTPNFNVNFKDLPEDADVGDVETAPAQKIPLQQLHGPWLMLTEGLQGELFVEQDGFVNFRPANNLGYGIGKISVKDTSIGFTTFQLRLETYTYENISANPPLHTKVFDVVGIISIATAKKSNYETMTLNGQVMPSKEGSTLASSAAAASSSMHMTTDNVLPFNAAKLTPWDPSASQSWLPSEDIRKGFAELFPEPLRLTSHLQRAHKTSVETSSSSGHHLPPKHLDLTPYKVGSIDNVYYIPKYASEAEQAQMLHQLKDTPPVLKSKLTKRLVQEWGCTMCSQCNQSFVSDANLPPWTEAVTDMLLFDGIYSPAIFPNNVRIHEYEVGEGIGPHCDGPIYVPRVAILSLASTSVISFYSRREPYAQPMEHYNDTFRFDGDIAKERPLLSVVLEPGSLLIFEKDAYTHYPHGISDRPVDSLAPEFAGEVVNRHLLSNPDIQEVKREYRVGVTVRNLLPRCNHQPGRAEFNMKRAWQLYHQEANVGFRLPLPSVGVSPSITSTAAVSSRDTHIPNSKTQPYSQSAGGVTVSASVSHNSSNAPSTTSMSHVDARQGMLESKVDQLLRQQDEILRAVRDLQLLVGNSATSQATFQKETSTVLNYLSTTVLELDSRVEDLVDESVAEERRK